MGCDDAVPSGLTMTTTHDCGAPADGEGDGDWLVVVRQLAAQPVARGAKVVLHGAR